MTAAINAITYLRSFVGACFVVPYTLVMSLAVIAAGFAGRSRFATRLIRVWGCLVLFVFGIRVRARGEGHLPVAGGGIIVFNHQSHFDIPAVVVATKKDIRFGAKIELFKIPFFGAAMRAVGTLPIARDNRSEVLRIYQEAQARFEKEGTIFVLAPEGTRQLKPEIGRFKKGPFLFAVNAQVPVIPVVIHGANEVLPKNRLSVNVGKLSRTIEIEFLPPVPTRGMTPDSIEDVMQRVRADMVAAYERLGSSC